MVKPIIAASAMALIFTVCTKQPADNTETTVQPATAEVPTAHKHGQGDCSCDQGKKGGTTWCQVCDMGYIKGVPSNDKAAVQKAMSDSTLTQAANPRDHRGCGCGKGKQGGTAWCDDCQKGFIKGVKTTDKAAVEKALANAPAEAAGHDHKACGCGMGKKGGTAWCETCQKGFIKGVLTKDKTAVDKALASN